MVEVFTEKKHRFGKSLNVAGVTVNIDEKGHAMIEEDLVSKALINGFELVNKNVQFTTEEEKAHINEVAQILESAKAQAEEIISKAQAEADRIILEANKEAGVILSENKVDEKKEKKERLSEMKVDDLKALCADSKIPEDQWKNLKKSELVDLLMSFIFDEK